MYNGAPQGAPAPEAPAFRRPSLKLAAGLYLWAVASLIGFSLVVVMLVALIFIMKAFGACFRVRPAAGSKIDAQPMISPEEVAAIATALKIYKGALHDRESEVLTILNIKRAYSPWNSKIHGLTQLPDRR